jgi:hypothetical protein
MMSMLPSLCTYRVSKLRWFRFSLVFISLLALLYLLTDTNCLVEAIIGIPCPGCGLTRASFALLSLDFNKAFQMHPLLILAYIDIALISVSIVTGKVSNITRNILIVSFVLFLGVYVYRMITMYPTIAPMKPNPHSLLNRLIELFQ